MSVEVADCPHCGLRVLQNDNGPALKLSHQLPVCEWFQSLVTEAKEEFGADATESAEILDADSGDASLTPVVARVEPPPAHDRHAYRDDCPGCQMVLIGPDGRPLPKEDPTAATAARVWWSTAFEVRSACQRVWVHNSRVPADLIAMEGVMRRVQRAMMS